MKALNLSLNSGRYPEYLGFEGPYQPNDPNSMDPLDYLQLLWPASLVDLIVEETNRYARSKKRAKWVDVCRDEMWTFLGVILAMGIHRLPRINNYWNRDSLLGIPEIQRHMSLSRFWAIWSNLHVVDNSKVSPSDGLNGKLRPVLDVLSDTFFMNYSPGQEMSVDEAMIKYKGHVKRGKVHMPKKPIKVGFKIWCSSCSCCGYLCAFQVYEGQPIDSSTGEKVPEKGMTMRVVQDLLSPFSDLNHVVYMDNFFTSGPLVDALAEMGIYTAGTIQQRACGFPSGLKDVKLPVGSYVAQSVGKTCYYTFRDRKLVSFVTNAFPETMDSKVARVPPKGNVLKYQSVPPVLPAYNKYMGAVDRLSQVRRTYGFDRKSKRYWIRAFMQFFDYAVNNACILYKHDCKRCQVKPMELLTFRLKLQRLLLRDTRCRRPSHQSTEDNACCMSVCHLKPVSDIGLARGRCHHCVQINREKIGYTSFGCSNCKVRLCKTTCFAEYHRN